MIENQEIDYSKLSEILAETEEPAFFKCFFNGTALRSLKAENAVFNDCKMSNIDFLIPILTVPFSETVI